MKRILSLILSPCLMLGFCACGNATEQDQTTAEPVAINQLDIPEFDYIAYSRFDDGDKGSINTEEHLRYCASLPYTTLKADVQPTADGGLVLCHDKGFTFKDGRIVTYDKNNNTPIINLTTEQCLSLEHNAQYDGKHCKITDFETFIKICAESNKWAYITVRDEHVNEIVAAVMPVLEKYNWVQNSVINSFTLFTLEAFRKAAPDIRLSYVLQLNKTLTRMDVDTAVRLGNCVITSFAFRATDQENGWSVVKASADGIAYAKTKGVRLYMAQMCEGADLERLVQAGYSGAQLRYVPDFPEK